MGDSRLRIPMFAEDPPTLPRTVDMKNPVTAARYKLLGPQLFYEWCDDLEPCPRIGWTTNTNGPPELVADILNTIYFHLRANNYDYDILDLDFWLSTKFRPGSQDIKEGWNDIQFISLVQRIGPPLCLPAQMFLSHHHVADIRLKLGGKWMQFIDFLDLLVLAAPVDPARMAYIWKHSGKKFDLLALPRELRDQIWSDAIFYDRRAFVKAPPRPCRSRQFEGVISHKGSFHSVALLNERMPQQIRDESRMVLWTKGTFQFKYTRDFSDFLLNAQPGELKMLRKVELSFGYQEWLCLLGAQLNSRHRFTACPSLNVLKAAQLHELKLVFREPMNLESSRCHLWYYEKGCHTKVLQWILDLLVPVIGHANIKKLKVEGFIKHAQKAHFFKKIEMFSKEIKKYKDMFEIDDITLADLKEEGDEDGGVSLAGAREQVFLAMPDFQVEAEFAPDQYDPEELYRNVTL